MIEPIIHYTGNKYTRLPQILPKIEGKFDRFIEPFAGSGVVGINAINSGIARSYWYNDIDTIVKELLFYAISTTNFVDVVHEIDNKYPKTKEGYYELRQDYNVYANLSHRDPESFAMLYVLIGRSFNNQIRFNRKGEFNLPYGERSKMKIDALKKVIGMYRNNSLSICYTSNDFEVVMEQATPNDFVFLDPPYTATTATYNSGWGELEDDALYKAIDRLSNRGVRWMLTNILMSRGKVNEPFQTFISENKGLVHSININGTYGNSSYHKSNDETVELLVTNFKIGEDDE